MSLPGHWTYLFSVLLAAYSTEASPLRVAAQQATLHPNGDLEASKVVVRNEAFHLRASKLLLDTPGNALLDNILAATHQGLVIRGSRGLYLVLEQRLELAHFQLVHRGHILSGDRAAVETRSGLLRIEDATFSLCPAAPGICELHTDFAAVHPSGDLDLLRPSLHLGGRKIAVFPFLRLRPPGKPGLLSPHLGFDRHGGFFAGPGGHLPLGENRAATGFVAPATRQGPRFATEFTGPQGQLRLRGTSDHHGPHLVLDGGSFARHDSTSMATTLDLPWDQEATSRLLSPLDQARNTHRTAALLSVTSDSALFEVSGSVLTTHTPASTLNTRASTNFWAWPRLAQAPWLAPHLGLSLVAMGNQANPTAVTALEAGLGIAHLIGPLAFEAGLRGKAGLDLSGNGRPVAPWSTLVSRGTVGVPLVSTSTRRLQHLAIPYVSGSSHLISGLDFSQRQARRELPTLVFSATAGLEFVVRCRSRDVLRGNIAQRLLWAAPESFYKFVRGNLVIGPPQLQIHGALNVDESTGRVLFLAAGIGTRLKSTSLESGVFHYASNIPQPFLLPLVDLPDEPRPGIAFNDSRPALTVARQRATLELGPYLSANAVAYETAWPKPRLDIWGYGVTVGPRCRCFQIRIDAWHRLGSAVPEISASIIAPTF